MNSVNKPYTDANRPEMDDNKIELMAIIVFAIIGTAFSIAFLLKVLLI